MQERRPVLVTGAAKRIGRVIATELYRRGFEVAIHYNTSQGEAVEVSRACGGAPVFQADLSKLDEIRRLFLEARQTLGPLFGLVNNAARFTKAEPLAITEEDWDATHNINLKAAFFCSQEAARDMQARGSGRIVNISSLGGLRPWPDHVHYCASKAGLIMLTQALAKALAPAITVNSVAPGAILPSEAESNLDSLIRATPMKRMGTPEDVAEAVHYFLTCSDFVTGQILAIDGGLGQR
jgi:NAD(P)-dependent dehydrogenase (short-subunit alcohol dehydrogenase family)